MSAVLLLLATLARIPALFSFIDPPVGPPAPTPAPATAPTPAPLPEGLGDPGRRAIEAERTARQEAEAELRRLRDSHRTDAERAVEAARLQGEQAGRQAAATEFGRERAELQRQRTADRVALAATGRLADPSAAARFLNLDTLLGDDGQPDDSRIGQALDQLVATVAGQTGQPPGLPARPGQTPGQPTPPAPLSYGAGEQGPRAPASAVGREDRVAAALAAVKTRTGIS